MAQVSQIPTELAAQMTPEVRAFVDSLLERIAQLEQGPRTPQNSSLPPSSQHPHARPGANPKTKARKKPGGQPGHKRHHRALIPTAECSEVIPLYPDSCRRCGRLLDGDDPQPLRHQVWELPEIKPLITEYQRHRRRCACCGETTCAPLPLGVPAGQSGPRLVAFTGLLMGHFRQSKRRAAFFLQDLLGVPCCPALAVKMQNQVAGALEGPYAELKDALAGQGNLSMDETPTRQGRDRAWLWAAVAELFVVFAIFSSRKATALPRLLGDAYGGVINCDRAKMYWRARRLQWCWAHLKRDIQGLIDHPDRQVKRLGHDLRREVRAMFELWGQYKSGQISWRAFRLRMGPIRARVNGYLLRGAYSGNPRLEGMCAELYDHREWLWTFVDVRGVEPTNNAAERAIRPAVIYRKLSFGTQSEAGSRFVERMLTVGETCRLQGRSIFQYLVSAVTAHFHQDKAPSLLPTP